MWMMTTKGRPLAAERVVNACWNTGMRQKAIMFVDGDPAGYNQIKLPDNWEMVLGCDVNHRGNLAGSKQFIFQNYPDERCYGWMADDNIPKTQYWSYIIEDVACPWYLVHCRDGWISEMPFPDNDILYRTGNLGGGICWGGDLVRSVGFLAPPGIVQAGIDWFWTSLCRDTPIGIYLHNVTVWHYNWRTGERDKDDNDNLEKPHIEDDLAYMKKYLASQGFDELRERVMREYHDYITGRA